MELGLLSLLTVGLLVGITRASFMNYGYGEPMEDKNFPKEKYDYLEYIEHGSFNIMD